MKRRQFVGGVAAAATAWGLRRDARQQESDCRGALLLQQAEETFEWSASDVMAAGAIPGLGVGVDNLAEAHRTRHPAGRLKIKIYAGGELVPAFEVIRRCQSRHRRDAVTMHRTTTRENSMRRSSSPRFRSVINYIEMNGWLYYGGGLELWRELYEPFNLVPFPCGNTGVQMGGWFNKEINSIDDLKGLKMRIPGLGGEVIRRAGATPVTLPASEIFTSLQTGVIDATEWVGPYNDVALGLHEVAKYYYYPGWQEPAPNLECFVNKEAWDSLPADLQSIIEISCQAITTDMMAEYTHGNAMALQQLMEDPNVEIRQFPDEVLQYLRSIAKDIVEEMVENDPAVAKIYASWSAFLEKSIPNQRITEQAFLNTRS